MIKLEKGMIGLSGGNSWIQKSIRFFTDSLFSHSFAIGDVSGILSVLETSDTVVTVSPVDRKYKETNWVQIWQVNASEWEKREAWEKTYIKYSAKWYGYETYLWFMYKWAMNKIKIYPKTMWKYVAKRPTCTVVTCDYLRNLNSAFFNLFKDIDINTITPQILADIMPQNPILFTFVGWMKER